MTEANIRNAKTALTITTVLTLFVAGFEVLMAMLCYKEGMNIFDLASWSTANMNAYCMILIIARFITSLGDNGVLMGAMAGLRAAALGMVVVALIQLMPAAIKNKWAMLAAVVAFVLIAVLKVNTAYVILLFAVLGITVTFAGSRKMAAAAEGSAGAENAEAGEGGESE